MFSFACGALLGMRIEVEKHPLLTKKEVVVLHNAIPVPPSESVATKQIKELQKLEPQFDPEHFIQLLSVCLLKSFKPLEAKGAF